MPGTGTTAEYPTDPIEQLRHELGQMPFGAPGYSLARKLMQQLDVAIGRTAEAQINATETALELGDMENQRNAVYRERAHLVAALAAHYPAEMHEDPDDEDWAIIYVKLPTGQASWHLSPQDQDLFPHIKYGGTFEWDEHTTDEKYRRIREHTAQFSAETAAYEHHDGTEDKRPF